VVLGKEVRGVSSREKAPSKLKEAPPPPAEGRRLPSTIDRVRDVPTL